MKVLALLGSPRPEGNTDLLLREVIRGIKTTKSEVRTYNLNLMNIKPCQDCGGCDKTGSCIISDDMSEIYQEIRRVDRVILASPIFFFSLSAQAKTMIDRCQSFWCEKYLLKKAIPGGKYGRKGLLIMVGGMKKEIGLECGDATAKAFFRTISVPEHAVLSFLGVDAKGAITEHPTALREAFEAGKQLVSV
ncbi:MAG: flavodoxin family protein [Nitrospirae bacterium]|nr:flavodoxin family protein [Nitrospirota bacterium]